MKNESLSSKPRSQWAKDVKKAAIDNDMTLTQIAKEIGYGYQAVSSVLNGSYSNVTYKTIAEKINAVLGTTGLPERIGFPSDEWCREVRIQLIKRDMNIRQLADELNAPKHRVSKVINGRMADEQLINEINELLGITLSAMPDD